MANATKQDILRVGVYFKEEETSSLSFQRRID